MAISKEIIPETCHKCGQKLKPKNYWRTMGKYFCSNECCDAFCNDEFSKAKSGIGFLN